MPLTWEAWAANFRRRSSSRSASLIAAAQSEISVTGKPSKLKSVTKSPQKIKKISTGNYRHGAEPAAPWREVAPSVPCSRRSNRWYPSAIQSQRQYFRIDSEISRIPMKIDSNRSYLEHGHLGGEGRSFRLKSLHLPLQLAGVTDFSFLGSRCWLSIRQNPENNRFFPVIRREKIQRWDEKIGWFSQVFSQKDNFLMLFLPRIFFNQKSRRLTFWLSSGPLAPILLTSPATQTSSHNQTAERTQPRTTTKIRPSSYSECGALVYSRCWNQIPSLHLAPGDGPSDSTSSSKKAASTDKLLKWDPFGGRSGFALDCPSDADDSAIGAGNPPLVDPLSSEREGNSMSANPKSWSESKRISLGIRSTVSECARRCPARGGGAVNSGTGSAANADGG